MPSVRQGAWEDGIHILRVPQIRNDRAPASIAHTLHGIEGVVNLRGFSVALVDRRLVLGCSRAES